MKLQRIIGGLVPVLVLAALAIGVMAQSTAYRVSTPYVYKNLTIFLIHGKNETSNKNVLTLQEAMERKVLRVYETSDVNELAVENVSKQFEVFIQSGDIVKGGKQDRILSVSIMIPPLSGRILIEAFCVESGRWQKRKQEDAGHFSSSNDRIVTKELKIAANGKRSQSDVWAQVSEAQARLSQNVGGSVAAAVSRTSLQLSLENGRVAGTADEYVNRLRGIIDGKSDVIGYAFAVNGRINSADVYASNTLFRKLWPKMLKASAIEAITEANSASSARPSAVRASAVEEFIDDAERARPAERAASGGVNVVTREDKDNVLFETRDEKAKAVIHRSYVKKQ
jgi:hypothetical protein